MDEQTIECGQDADSGPRGTLCGKAARRREKLPWEPDSQAGCCDEHFEQYIAHKDFTREEAERFFPLIEAS